MINIFKVLKSTAKTTMTKLPTNDLPKLSSEDMRKVNQKVENIIDGINPKLGTKLKKHNEKKENRVQTQENFEDAIDPFSIIIRALSPSETKFQLGEHLYVQRFGYTHHGVYVGDNHVIHYLMDEGVIQVSVEDFARGAKVHIKQSDKDRTDGEIVTRAYSRLGEGKYNLFQNNCEHFVTWCRSGR